MKFLWKASAMALFGLLAMAPVASAGVIVRGGFGPVWVGHYGGPAYAYGPYPYAYGPYPYYAYGYPGAVQPYGEVKVDKAMPGGSIYVDGGYVGKTNKATKLPLSPGNHEIQVRDPQGNMYYRETVDVIPGKTIAIQPFFNQG